jgi:hypothetical protein
MPIAHSPAAGPFEVAGSPFRLIEHASLVALADLGLTIPQIARYLSIGPDEIRRRLCGSHAGFIGERREPG